MLKTTRKTPWWQSSLVRRVLPGSLVLDRHGRTAYVATSKRADRNLAEIWAKERFHGRSGVNLWGLELKEMRVASFQMNLDDSLSNVANTLVGTTLWYRVLGSLHGRWFPAFVS